MTLFKTSILSLIATAFKMLAGLVINKAVSLYIGPAGLALIGQFQSFSQLAMTAAQGAINTGVTKYTAQYTSEGKDISLLFSTALKISLFCSILVGSLIIFMSRYISISFLNKPSYYYVFIIFGFTIVLFVLNNLLLSIINGLKEIKTFISINIIQSLFSIFLTTTLIILIGLDGALIALVTNQSLVFLPLYFLSETIQL